MAFELTRRLGLAAAISALVLGCAPKEEKTPPTIAQVTIAAAKDANPNADGQPRPVVVHIFAMKTGSGFDSASYDQLSGDLGSLAEQMKQVGRVVMPPGKNRKLVLELEKDVTEVGVAVGYNQLDSAKWRGKTAIKPQKVTLVEVGIGKSAVSVKAK